MTTDIGRDPPGQALAVPVEPQERLAPTGFDPSRNHPADYTAGWNDAIQHCVAIAERWRDENKAERARALKSGRRRFDLLGDETMFVMAEQGRQVSWVRALQQCAHVMAEAHACREAGFTTEALNYPRSREGLIALCAFNGIKPEQAPRGWHYWPNPAMQKSWERVITVLKVPA